MKDEYRNPDCGCSTHSGPHWLYMDWWDYQNNLTYLQRFCDALLFGPKTVDGRYDWQHVRQAWYGWCCVEQNRLRAKQWNMKFYAIDAVSYDLLDPEDPTRFTHILVNRSIIVSRIQHIYQFHGLRFEDNQSEAQEGKRCLKALMEEKVCRLHRLRRGRRPQMQSNPLP